MKNNKKLTPRVCLISEFPPPAAGMTVQAHQLLTRFKDENLDITGIRTNPELGCFSWIDKIKVVRSVIKWIIFLFNCRKILSCNIVHIFSSSGLNYYLFTLPPLYLGHFLGKKVIINYHGGGAKGYFSKRPVLLSKSMAISDSLIVPSGFLQDVFKAFGYTSKIIGNIANIERFTFNQRESYEPIVISTRNLTSVYNIHCALKAFRILQDQHSYAILYIAGDGPDRADLEALASELKLENIFFLGNLPNEEVPVYMNKAHVFINTSTIDNMPGSILEAYAAGLPVVSTNVGGIPYMVDHEKTGLLANNNDYETLGKYLIKVVDNPDYSKVLVENGYEVIKDLSWSNIRTLWLNEYQSLIEK